MAKPRHLRLSKRVVDRLPVEAEPGDALGACAVGIRESGFAAANSYGAGS